MVSVNVKQGLGVIETGYRGGVDSSGPALMELAPSVGYPLSILADRR